LRSVAIVISEKSTTEIDVLSDLLFLGLLLLGGSSASSRGGSGSSSAGTDLAFSLLDKFVDLFASESFNTSFNLIGISLHSSFFQHFFNSSGIDVLTRESAEAISSEVFHLRFL
jgi:hypothetical protein